MVEKIIWSPQARDDLDGIYLSLSDFNELYAKNWASKVFDKVDLIKQFPHIGIIIKEKEVSFIREISVGNYKIAYAVLDQEIRILKIVHKNSPFGKI